MLLLSLMGCVAAPGQGFGTVPQASLTLSWQGKGRVPTGETAVWRSASHLFVLEDGGLSVRTGPLVLEGTTGTARTDAAGGAATSFDPAAPPAGFSLCHNGHCHAADGRLVPYDQVPLELARANGELVTQDFLSLGPAGLPDPVGVSRPQAEIALSCVGCALPEGRLVSTALGLEAVRLSGTVTSRDPLNPLDGDVRRFVLDWTGPALVFRDAVDLPLSWTRPERLALRAQLEMPEDLLDGLPWADLARSTPVGTLSPASDAASREAFLASL
ncbi:MAG: hypothetical protein VKO21_12070, partial [Candidatus Sericytochromatia bacterium]|nr:hypothetical protein [Candidatus Sericytochromatia bacterium]